MKTLEQFLLEASALQQILKKYKKEVHRLNVYELPDKISIDLIIVNTKNKGAGSNIMRDIVQYSNEAQKTIILTPTDEFGGDKYKLIEFYKRFGFIENKGKNKIIGIFEEMYRLPDKEISNVKF